MANSSNYMTIPEMEDYLHVSRKTAYAIMAGGKIPIYRISPRKTLVRKVDVDKYITKYRV